MDKVKHYSKFLMIMAGLGGLLYGVDLGVIAAALPYIDKTAYYTPEETGLIVGMVLWGSVMSSLIAGPLSDKFGRKKIIILSALCFTLSIPIICASGFFIGGNFPLLASGRLLQGAAAGLIGVVVPMYLAECLDAKVRGRGTATFQLILTLGLVFAAIVGLVVTYLVGVPYAGETNPEILTSWTIAWQTIFWVSAVPGLFLFFGAFKLQESPRWLYKKGRKNEALASLAANNGEEKAKEILQQIIDAEKAEKATKDADAANKESLLKKKYVVPFVLAVLVLVCTQATGMSSVLNYSVTIFSQCGMVGEFANWCDLAIKLVNFLVTFLAIYLVDRKGRKYLLRLGTGGILIGQLGIGVMFLMLQNNVIPTNLTSGIIVTIFFFVFVTFYALGPGVCVWLALSELMPTRIRANGMAIGMVLNQATSATIASIFPTWVDASGFATVFFVLSIATLIYFLVATFLLPETKGKTLEEISKFFE